MTGARGILRFGMALAGAAAASVALWRGLSPKSPLSLEAGDFGAVSDFRLTERSGRPVSRDDLRGKVWVADFIFTRCMGPCPAISKTFSRLQASLAGAPDVRLVSFTVDPSHDTPDVLAGYAERFGADPERWLFLTGETEKVRSLILESFKLAVQENTGPARRPGEEVSHSLHFVVVDKTGRLRGYFEGTDAGAVGRLKKRVEELL